MLAKSHLVSAAPLQKTQVGSVRLTMTAGESHRLSNCQQWLRVISGEAWITHKGEDILLRAGEWVSLPQDRYPAVLSAAQFASEGAVDVELYWEK